MKEREIQNVIMDYLSLKRRFFWRNNSGGFKNNLGHFYRFGDTGSPDIFVVKDGKIYGIEVKAPKGQQRDTQKTWQKNFEEAGGIYILARDIDDVALRL